MRMRCLYTVRLVLSSCAIAAAVIAMPVSAQQRVKMPRTEHGYPDLQGVWTNATITPLERPAQYGERRAHTPEETTRLEQAVFDANAEADRPTDPSATVQQVNSTCEIRGFSGVACGYNNFWVDPGTKLIDINGEKRTSIIVDPPNGRIPSLIARARPEDGGAPARAYGPYDGPEVRPLGERCIMSFGSSAGPPMLPLLYNNNCIDSPWRTRPRCLNHSPGSWRSTPAKAISTSMLATRATTRCQGFSPGLAQRSAPRKQRVNQPRNSDAVSPQR